jgi:hypothetical protein
MTILTHHAARRPYGKMLLPATGVSPTDPIMIRLCVISGG